MSSSMANYRYPTIEKPTEGRVILRVPKEFVADPRGGTKIKSPRRWLAQVCGNEPGHLEWDKAGMFWTAPRHHFRRLIAAFVAKYGRCQVIEHYRVTERCWESCVQALPDSDCVCSCRGDNHGREALHAGWREITTPNLDAGPMYLRSSPSYRIFMVPR